MKIPSKFQIAGQTYTVEYEPSMDDMGDHSSPFNRIRLNPNYPQERIEQTFIHELLHAVRANSAREHPDSATEEEIVDSMSGLLYQVLKDML